MPGSSSGFSLGETFSEAFRVLRENPIIIVPSLLPFVWMLLVSIIGPILIMSLFYVDPYGLGPEYAVPTTFGFLAGLTLYTVIFFVLYMLASSVTIELVRQAYDESRVRLGEAFREALRRAGHVLLATLLVGVSVAIGELLFVLPGIILMFLFWFVPQAIMIDEEGGVSSLGQSIAFFRENTWDAFILILLSIVIYSLFLVLSWIPVVGAILLLVGMPFLTAVNTVFYLNRT
jgi:hypothetical protein